MTLSRALAMLASSAVLSALSFSTFSLSASGLQAAEWIGSDLGKPGATGSFTAAEKSLTVRGGGAGPFFVNKAWAGQFTHQTVSGDFQFTARLRHAAIPGAQAGLMVRDSLDPLGRFRIIFFDQESNGVRGLQRYADGNINWGYERVMLPATDLWLRFERSGEMLVARCSSNGMDWKLLSPGRMAGPGLPDWVTSAKSLEVGCAVMGSGTDAALATAIFDHVHLDTKPVHAVTASWVGNSEGAIPNWVQNHVAAMTVTADGTVFTAAEWDEGSREMGIYKDGVVSGQLEGNFHDGKAHGAITSDEKFVIIGGQFEGLGCGLRRYDHTGKEVGWGLNERFLALPNLAHVGSVVVQGDLVAVADFDQFKPEASADTVTVFDLSKRPLRVTGTWKIPRLNRVTMSPDGDVWALQGGALSDGKRRNIGDAGGDKQVCFVGRGLTDSAIVTPGSVVRLRPGVVQPLSTVTIAHSDPSALAVTRDGRQLWIADNGPAQRVRIYDITGATPQPAGFFGDEGGVYGGVRPGAQAEGKLPAQINGLGFDAQGNVYLAGDGWSWCGADLRSYSTTGKRRWQLVGLHGVVDMGGFDPTSDQHIFSGSEHFTMDWSKPAGQQWTYTGYTLDPFRFPEDMRLSYAHESTKAHQIDGQRLLSVSNMYGDWLAIYRFDKAHGEIAIPCAWINARGGWVAGTPKDPWLWQDRNGDGRRQADEFTTFPNNYPGAGPGLQLDSTGNLWVGGMSVQRFSFTGFDGRGAPTWNPTPIIAPRPALFPNQGGNEIRQLHYLPETDQMWLGGWIEGHRNPWIFFGTVGSGLVRYDHWSTAPTPAVRIDLPIDYQQAELFTKSMAIAGDYVFTGDLYDARIVIYDARNGNLVKSFVPPATLSGRTGWIDISYGIDVVKRANGDYAVLVEDDAFGKMNLYSWNPASDTKPAAPKIRSENGGLTWDADESVGSWQISALSADGKSEILLQRNLRDTTFADQTLLSGKRTYVVRAVNAAGTSVNSAPVELVAKIAGTAMTGTPIGDNPQTVIEAGKAIDGDPLTGASCPGKGGWIGLDLGTGQVLSQVRMLPRDKISMYLENASIQVTNDDPKLGHWTVLASVSPVVATGDWTTIAITDQRPWRYVRLVTAVGNDVNVAEWDILGVK